MCFVIMSKIKIKEIISFSSEDPAHPASNLLENATFRKWKCKECGEAEACVIFQLENAVSITGVDIGNECSAMVEVLVSRSGDPSKAFHTLLSAVMLMSPLESRDLQSRNRVRMFRKDKLDKAVMAEKWDIIKVVCTQPHNKHTQYGLSFITFFKEADLNDSKPKIGSFAILPSSEEEEADSPKMGSLFAKRMELQPSKDPDKKDSTTKVSSAVLLRTPPSSSSFGSGSKVQDLISKSKSKPAAPSRDDQDFDQPQPAATLSKGSQNQAQTSLSKSVSSSSSSTSQSAKRSTDSKPSKPVQNRKRRTKPFDKLFEDVTFVLSGYENPYRGELRQKGLDMGAKCKPDWNSSCTHLICAFVNTPKFRQVRAAGDGKIVTSKWIEECHRKRCRLPWRRFCTDRNDRGSDSEEEVYAEGDDDEDEASGDGHNGSEEASSSQSSDLNVAKKRKRIQLLESSSDEEPAAEEPNADNEHNEQDMYGGDTDVDEDPEKEPSQSGIFVSTVFYVDPKWSLLQAEKRKEIIRIITDGKGTVSPTLNDDVDYFVTHQTNWNEDFSEALSDNPNLTFVRGDWVIECGKKGRKIAYGSSLILPN